MSIHKYRKCPPGIICFENITLVLLIITLSIIGYLIYSNISRNKNIQINEKVVIRENRNYEHRPNSFFQSFGLPNYPYNNYPAKDVYLNPYTPPLSDERYFVPERVPINIPTNVGAVDTSYRQVGILTPLHGAKKILPLMGRPLFVNRNKWQYYTMSDQNNSIKLPVSKGGRSCTNENGCDQLYSGDSIYVEGYNEAFNTTIYDSDTIKYIPYM